MEIEIMAPVGSYESLSAAIKAGANSVYFGITQLNMRARSANNFYLTDLEKIAKICSENNLKSYLTLNTLLYDHDLELMKKIVLAAKKAGISAIIAADMAAILFCKEKGMQVHISTQMSISNIEAVKFFSQYSDVVVLARELNLSQIRKISDEISSLDIRGPSGELVRIEAFAHGALCIAVSGRCHMSLYQYNASANRGACLQSCRRAYKVIDEETGKEMKIDNKYVMSPDDICTIDFLDKFIEAGVKVLKIEGRGRKADYVYSVVRAYRQAVDSVADGTFSKEKVEMWMKDLSSVYNRGLSDGYYLGKELHSWSNSYGSKSTHEKVLLGRVNNYYKKAQVVEVVLESGPLHKEPVLFTGPTTGVSKGEISEMQVKDKGVETASKGDIVTFPFPELVRKNDKFFAVRQRFSHQGEA